jgi:hypothetical protein
MPKRPKKRQSGAVGLAMEIPKCITPQKVLLCFLEVRIMYSIVLAMALSGSAETPAWGNGCWGYSCYGCWGYSCYGCWGGRRNGCWGYSCYGCRGAMPAPGH